MSNTFPLVQADLAKHLPTFGEHTQAQLLESDISPTECITTICDGNRDACIKVPAEMVRHFATLAGSTCKPRFLRFLRKIMMPTGDVSSLIQRNMQLVISALVDARDVFVLFNDPAGRAERAQLMEDNDLALHPRGKLAYHVELVTMLAAMASSGDKDVKSFVRDTLTLRDVRAQRIHTPWDIPRSLST